MLKDGTGFSQVIICCGRVDLRRGMDGLAAYVRLNYELDPFEKGVLYLFCGNQCDRIRGICFEGIGMGMYTLRLSKGNRFQWPRNSDEARLITPEQYQRLMAGIAIEGTIRETFPNRNRTPENNGKSEIK